jgi:hypothetical protein
MVLGADVMMASYQKKMSA